MEKVGGRGRSHRYTLLTLDRTLNATQGIRGRKVERRDKQHAQKELRGRFTSNTTKRQETVSTTAKTTKRFILVGSKGFQYTSEKRKRKSNCHQQHSTLSWHGFSSRLHIFQCQLKQLFVLWFSRPLECTRVQFCAWSQSYWVMQ